MRRADLAELKKHEVKALAGREIRVRRALVRRLEEQAELNDPDALISLAWVLLMVRPRAPRRASGLYRRALAGSSRKIALYNLANLALRARRNSEAVDLLRSSSQLGYPAAQVQLAELYLDGHMVRKALPKAERLLQAAYRAGNAEAALLLGWKRDFYDRNRWKEAARWYRRAAEHGLIEGIFNFALCLERGLGVRRDRAAAMRWYRKGVRMGDDDSRRALARLRAE